MYALYQSGLYSNHSDHTYATKTMNMSSGWRGGCNTNLLTNHSTTRMTYDKHCNYFKHCTRNTKQTQTCIHAITADNSSLYTPQVKDKVHYRYYTHYLHSASHKWLLGKTQPQQRSQRHTKHNWAIVVNAYTCMASTSTGIMLDRNYYDVITVTIEC